MDWINVPDNVEDWFGFIYRIERINALPGERRFYIGKKQFFSNTKVKVKNKTRCKRVSKPSDWKRYYGSSNELKAAIALHGKENFKREILELTTCKWESAYLELIWQLKENVIVREDYYNGILNLRIGKVPKDLKQKLTDRFNQG